MCHANEDLVFPSDQVFQWLHNLGGKDAEMPALVKIPGPEVALTVRGRWKLQ